MKKFVFALIISAIILAPIVLATNSKQTEPLDKVTFIHYKDGTSKIVGGAAKSPTCFKLTGVKWKTLSLKYVINPGTNGETFVTNAISASTGEWDSHTSANLFSDYGVDYSATINDEANSPDYKNEYVFGTYPDNNVIAVTTYWYTRFGKQIVDYDVLFNTYYNWYDCAVTTCDAANNGMDLENIATHETGHGIGLSDIYSTSCSAVTMYGYSVYGETQKRTLEPADIAGIQKLYGS